MDVFRPVLLPGPHQPYSLYSANTIDPVLFTGSQRGELLLAMFL